MSGYLKCSLPAQTSPAIRSLSGVMVVFHRYSNCIIASTSQWGTIGLWNHPLSGGDLGMWNPILPTLTHAIQECKRKRKTKEKVNRRELKQTRVMSERAQSHSTTCSSTLFPHWRGKCDVPYEGSRLPRRLEWAKRADWLPAGWARLSWAVQCLQLDTQPSVWTRTSCCPSHHPSPLGWWCFLST